MESLYPAAPGFCHCLAALKTTPVLVQKNGSLFITVFFPVFPRIFKRSFHPVFKGQKICLRYFEIGQTYFELCALYFFFAPMRV